MVYDHFPECKVHRQNCSKQFSLEGLSATFHLAIFLDKFHEDAVPRGQLLLLLDRRTWKATQKHVSARDAIFRGPVVLANVDSPRTNGLAASHPPLNGANVRHGSALPIHVKV